MMEDAIKIATSLFYSGGTVTRVSACADSSDTSPSGFPTQRSV